LGREEFVDATTHKSVDIPVRTIALEEMIACLKRVRRSVDKWKKHGSRRGYFEFVSQVHSLK
jgi:hypothetical protein